MYIRSGTQLALDAWNEGGEIRNAMIHVHVPDACDAKSMGSLVSARADSRRSPAASRAHLDQEPLHHIPAICWCFDLTLLEPTKVSNPIAVMTIDVSSAQRNVGREAGVDDHGRSHLASNEPYCFVTGQLRSNAYDGEDRK